MTSFLQVDFAVPEDHEEKIKDSEKIGKYLDLAREQKTEGCAGDGDMNCSWYTCNDPWWIRNGIGTVGDRKKNQDHPLLKTVKIIKRILKN